MENASKALLLAAAILIAIILISLGVMIVSKGSFFVKQSISSVDDLSASQFNQQFEMYEGTFTGSSVKDLIRVVSSSNQSHEGQQVTLDGDSTLWTTSTDSSTGVTTYKATNKIGSNKKYTIEIEQPYTSGIVSKIKINAAN